MVRKRALLTAGVVTAGLVAGAPGSAVAGPREPSKIVYVTFDDGPYRTNDSRLLPLLRRERVPATFFLVGSRLANDPSIATRLWLSGHAVGNHTYSHPDLTGLDASGVFHQLASTQRLLGRAGGRCMRPPYGAVNSTTYAAAGRLGLKTVLWDVDPEDWAHQGSTSYIVDHVLTHVRHRSVVLLHDGGGPRAATVAAVRQLIPRLRARGYEFRTVPACRVPLRGTIRGGSEKLPKKQRPPVAPTPTPQPTTTTPGVTQ